MRAVDHRQKNAEPGTDSYAASAVKANPCNIETHQTENVHHLPSAAVPPMNLVAHTKKQHFVRGLGVSLHAPAPQNTTRGSAINRPTSILYHAPTKINIERGMAENTQQGIRQASGRRSAKALMTPSGFAATSLHSKGSPRHPPEVRETRQSLYHPSDSPRKNKACAGYGVRSRRGAAIGGKTRGGTTTTAHNKLPFVRRNRPGLSGIAEKPRGTTLTNYRNIHGRG